MRSLCLEVSPYQGSTHSGDVGGQATSHGLIFKERACHTASRPFPVESSNAASWKPGVPATVPLERGHLVVGRYRSLDYRRSNSSGDLASLLAAGNSLCCPSIESAGGETSVPPALAAP
jgi:hypothetical protein